MVAMCPWSEDNPNTAALFPLKSVEKMRHGTNIRVVPAVHDKEHKIFLAARLCSNAIVKAATSSVTKTITPTLRYMPVIG
jgi:hypothetical protein